MSGQGPNSGPKAENGARALSGRMKALLEFGPIIAFFAGYVLLKDRSFAIAGAEYSGFLVVTAAFIPLMIASTAAIWALTGRLSPMQIVTLVLVVVFGGLSVWLQDERLFKMKPTAIYLIFAAILGFGLARGESYLKLVLGEALPMKAEGWMILTKRMTGFFILLAIANEGIWRSFSTETWVSFKTFGLPVALFAFLMTQGKLFEAQALPKDDASKDAGN